MRFYPLSGSPGYTQIKSNTASTVSLHQSYSNCTNNDHLCITCACRHNETANKALTFPQFLFAKCPFLRRDFNDFPLECHLRKVSSSCMGSWDHVVGGTTPAPSPVPLSRMAAADVQLEPMSQHVVMCAPPAFNLPGTWPRSDRQQ